MKKSTKIWLIVCSICFSIGILLCTIGIVMGFRFGNFIELAEEGRFTVIDDGSLSWLSEDVAQQYAVNDGEEITDLYIDIEYTNLTIKEHDKDEFLLEGKAYKGISSDIYGGTLEIRDSRKGFFRFVRRSVTKNNITLYVPADYRFDSVEVNAGAGTLKIESLSSQKAVVEIGAGSFNGKDFDVSGEMILNAGAGNMKLEGNFDGNVYAECGVGNITMNASGDYTKYNYEVECGVGNVKVGPNNYSGLGREKHIDNNSEYTMFLKCGVGNLKVKF